MSPSPANEAPRRPNRLAREKSPYLLQHATNPVDWFPWGEEAFERARREEKPIFLSIGYSTCHWCHVMERESFENDAIADRLNQWFVPVKVDREERPDVDRIYMTAAQAMGMGGGWPLNVFLTPELEPFYGGTYFPPEARYGRPGIGDVLAGVHEAWRTRRDEVRRSGATVLRALEGLRAPDTTAEPLDRLEDQAWEALTRMHDAAEGGFGNAPKFPSVANLDFLVRHALRRPDRREAALAMVRRQLDAMRVGGIHDRIGGGFHRYATDREWNVPHFEKMLYDQAQLAWAYLDGWLLFADPDHAATARGVFDYVARDLTSPEGAFWSAEDADSEGVEGQFYLWTPGQIEQELGPEEAALVAQAWDVLPPGNFEHGASILRERVPVQRLAGALHEYPASIAARLEAARVKLLAARSRRVRPHRDDKVLVAWNGLMIAALARGARALGEPERAAAAERAASFIWERLRDATTGALARRWRDGETAGEGQLDDHAYYAHGLIELFQATQDPRWLERAVEITDQQLARFWDDADGGFFESPADDPSLKVRMKDAFDGAELAGNSIAAWNLQVLAALLDRPDWLERARRTFEHFARRLAGGPAAMPRMLVAMDLARAPMRHVVIAGDPAAADTRALVRAFDRRLRPRDLRLVVDGGERQRRLAAQLPFVDNLRPQDGRATAHVCVEFACRLPTTDPETFEAQLEEPAPRSPGEEKP